LALACTAPGLDRIVRKAFAEPDAPYWQSPAWHRLVLISLLCFLATFLNPYHWHLYAVVVDYATQASPYQLIVDCSAMAFREPWDWCVLALAGMAAFSLGRRRASAFEILLLASSAYFSFHARRDSWFVVVVAAALIPEKQEQPSPGTRDSRRNTIFSVMTAVAVLGIVLGIAAVRRLDEEHLWEAAAREYPVQAARIVAANGYTGPLYNHFNWGGYLIGSLPDLPVAIDGRTNLHGDERIRRFEHTWNGLAGWHTDPDLQAAGVIVAPANLPLSDLLRTDPRFKLVYEDPVALVFISHPHP
jgi:hypothetical protein